MDKERDGRIECRRKHHETGGRCGWLLLTSLTHEKPPMEWTSTWMLGVTTAAPLAFIGTRAPLKAGTYSWQAASRPSESAGRCSDRVGKWCSERMFIVSFVTIVRSGGQACEMWRAAMSQTLEHMQ